MTFKRKAIATAVLFATAGASQAADINFSATLSGQYTNNSETPYFEETVEGFGLGENEIAVSGFIDKNFYGKLTGVLVQHGDKVELEIEEAFVQAVDIGGGVGIRAGRFLSNVGYLNSRHIHQDAFTRRPAMYQAFFGKHYFDDGIRANYILPTDIYANFGVEVLAGGKLAQGHEVKNPNVTNVFAKFGDDFNESHSWQLGATVMLNQAGAAELGHEAHIEPQADEHGHEEHGHNALASGKKMYVLDGVYKWSPQGNNKYQQLTISGEYILADDIFDIHEHEEHEEHGEEEHHDEHGYDNHQAWYASAVYKFLPSWSAGIRYGELTMVNGHMDGEEAHLTEGKLKETEAMISYHASHNSVITLQYTHQNGVNWEHDHVNMQPNNMIMLQYKMNLGDHGAHAF
ncbi:hypothetical protein [Paraferrimonas sp. SM1919]|uniref:hypothetical protein n=1 Tax=Paraferrimonas sp. SM1919 TaxID=2662263 RepID=UPI0013D55EBD|nr:hypothetical protein [Paraferrimonas sp. SM1919]